METIFTTTEELESHISSIIEEARKQAYYIIEEIMWETLSEAGHCILKNDSLHLLSRRGINGISSTTFNDICKTIEGSGDFSTIDERHKKMYLLEFLKARSLSFEVTRLKYPNYLKPWTESDDATLEKLWCEGMSVKELSNLFERNPGAIDARIEKLELVEKYGEKPQKCI